MAKYWSPLAAIVALSLTVPAAAQVADSGYTFLQAVRERDGNKVTDLLNQPGTTVVNYRDSSGEGALHIVTGRRDLTYLRFLIGAGADVNLGNKVGDTPLIIASRIGFAEGVDALLRSGAQVDRTNRQGETALIVAVQQRQLPVIRRLVESGADPDKTDNATGRSARDYAKRDARGPEMLKLMENAKPKPKAAGPVL
jgi:ankyrin repeat protein